VGGERRSGSGARRGGVRVLRCAALRACMHGTGVKILHGESGLVSRPGKGSFVRERGGRSERLIAFFSPVCCFKI
jgi:hypothetical protein